MKISLVKKLSYFIPETDFDKETFNKIAQGEVFNVDLKKVRNPKHHRKFFALLNLVYENLPEDFAIQATGEIIKINSIDDLVWHIKMQNGYYEQKISLGGRITFEAKSISFGSMDQLEFNEFYEKAINTILKYFLVGTDRNELEEMIAIHF